jgi:hypothetical protein
MQFSAQCTLAEWQMREKPVSELIVQASTMDGKDGWQSFMIGMGYKYIINEKKHGTQALQIGSHEDTVLCMMNDRTDETRRRRANVNRMKIAQTLRRNGISNRAINDELYFLLLPRTKFVISPEGNGIDCHRHYESLWAGCIPIMEENPNIQMKYRGLPVLWTRDYSEITESYLQQAYAQMINQDYDFSKLFLSSYDEEEQKKIKTCGNYWCNQVMGNPFYDN